MIRPSSIMAFRNGACAETFGTGPGYWGGRAAGTYNYTGEKTTIATSLYRGKSLQMYKRRGDQRRHSALRTISGGICCGLTFRLPGSMQLLLLGYQQIVNSAGFNNSLCFFTFADIINHQFHKRRQSSRTILLSANSGKDFR